MIKRILVGLGGTPFTSVAVRRAVELGQLHQAELTGVTVVDLKRLTHIGAAPIGAGGAIEELCQYRVSVTKQRIEEAVAEFETACTGAGIKHVVDRETGDPFALMTSLARYHDLMIFGLQSIFDYGFCVEPPDALAHLIGHGVGPIVAVSEQFRPVRRVLMAYSGSAESAKTIKRFVQLRPWPEVTLKVITCHCPRETAQQRLADVAAYCRAHGHDPQLEHLPEPAKRQILTHAVGWDADLIVLGNSARSYLMRKIFGETAIHVMENADRCLFLSY